MPSNAPDDVKVILEISSIWYHPRKADEVRMKGVSKTLRDPALRHTSYYGQVSDVSPRTSRGDRPV